MLMNLFIETLTGLTFELRVSPVESIMSVKSKIQRAEGIPVSQQHLVWQNSELEDHHRLRDYSICPDSTVRLILGLRGGPLNAPRIPPVRLTPLHFTPVIPQCRSKGSGINRSTRLSRFPLPSLGSHRLPSSLGIPNSFDKSGKAKGINYPYTELSTENKDLCGRQTSGSATDVIDNPLAEGDGTAKTANYRLPLIQAPISSTASAPSLTNGEKSATKNCVNENWDESNAVDHLTNTLGSLFGEKSRSSKIATSSVHQSSSLNAVNLASQDSECTGDQVTAEVPTSSSSVLDYPPLITSNSFRSPLTRFDLPSYWRLYEPREVVVPQVSAALTSLSTTGEHQNDGVAAGPSGGGHNPSSTIKSSSQPDEVDEDELVTTTTTPVASSTTAAAAAAAASILTSLLSTTTGDVQHLSLPCQKNGTEHSFPGHIPYPFHWLRRSSPLSGPHFLGARGTAIFAPGDDAASADLFRASADMDLEVEADNDDEEEEGVSDFENDDSGEESKPASNLYTIQDDDDDDEDRDNNEEEDDGDDDEDDDDSLADLEDYLFYYRTGDLLFGPPPSVPSTATCAPYSYYTTLRDSYATDLWRDILENSRDCGHKTRREEKQDGLKADVDRVENSSWRAECKELTEQVKDLKNRMENARSRRLNRRRNAGQASDAQTQPMEDAKTGPPQSELRSYPDAPADPSSTTTANTIISRAPINSDEKSTSSSIASANRFDGRRQRRFGTVTPPELGLLVQPACQSESPSVGDGETGVGTKPLETYCNLRPAAVFDGVTKSTQPDSANKSALAPGPSSRVLPSTGDQPSFASPQLVVETNSELSKTPDRKVVTPSKVLSPPNSLRRKRCSLCLRKTGLVNSYSCRCGRNFCSRHRYAELHACPFDYKAEGRRALLESNPVIAAPKLPKI